MIKRSPPLHSLRLQSANTHPPWPPSLNGEFAMAGLAGKAKGIHRNRFRPDSGRPDRRCRCHLLACGGHRIAAIRPDRGTPDRQHARVYRAGAGPRRPPVGCLGNGGGTKRSGAETGCSGRSYADRCLAKLAEYYASASLWDDARKTAKRIRDALIRSEIEQSLNDRAKTGGAGAASPAGQADKPDGWESRARQMLDQLESKGFANYRSRADRSLSQGRPS